MLKSYIFSLPVDKEVMFTDYTGSYKKKIEKQQRDLIVKIPFIKPFLEPDENILLITTGYSRANTLDQILTAWLFIYLKRSLFVFTNKRIFHIPTTVDYGYRYSIAQILFSENQSITLKGSSLIVECGLCGDQTKFIGIRGKEKKKIHAIMKTIEFEERYMSASEKTHLCPHCTKELTQGKHVCPSCKLRFKRKSKLRSLVPGIGYFYVRQTFLGIFNIVVELVFIGFLISFYIKSSQGLETSILSMVLIGVLYIYHKMAVICHSNHFIEEYIPEIEVVRPQSTL